MDDIELTLLSLKEACGDVVGEGQLDVLKKYGAMAAMTDLAIIRGGSLGKIFLRLQIIKVYLEDLEHIGQKLIMFRVKFAV